MPRKLEFRILSCTGSEEHFEPESLTKQSPLSKGWRTPRFCPYPQQLSLQLHHRACRVRKIQVLSHQQFIPTRLILEIAPPTEEVHLRPDESSWRRLGHIQFGDNEHSKYQTRELKTVQVDVVARYFRIVVHQNHINHYNLFNQVGIVALNFIGDDASYLTAPMKMISPGFMQDNTDAEGRATPQQRTESEMAEEVDKLIQSFMPNPMDGHRVVTDYALWGSINQPLQNESITDDLSFGVYQDPEIAKLIRQLEDKKNKAVMHEWYEHAKLLKQAIVDMQKFGERMGRLEAEKIRAVENEDFDLATAKKAEKEEMTVKAMDCLKLHHIVSSSSLLPDVLATVGASGQLPSVMQLDADGRQPQAQPQAQPPELYSIDTIDRKVPRQLPPIDREAFTLPSPPQIPTFPPLPEPPRSVQLPAVEEPRMSPVQRIVQAAYPATPLPIPHQAQPSGLEVDNRPTPNQNWSPEEQHPGSLLGRSALRDLDLSESPPQAQPGKVLGKNHDDKPLRAPPDRNAQPDENDATDEEVGSGDQPDQGPPPLSGKVATRYKASISVFSHSAIKHLMSKNFAHRSEGLQEAINRLLDTTKPLTEEHSVTAVERAVLQLLTLALKDRVFVVLQEATSLFLHGLDAISSSKSDVSHLISKAFPMLLQRVGDQAPRIASHSRDVVVQLSASPIVKPLNIICPAAMEQLKKSDQSIQQLYKGRIDLLGDLLKENNLAAGLTVTGMMKFVQPAYDHRNGGVRTAATKLVVELYKRFGGQDVRKFLPVDTPYNRKKPFFKNIFAEFDRMDGKPTKDDLKAKADAEEAAQAKQIQQLQEQMKELKALTAQRGGGELPSETQNLPVKPSTPAKKTKKPVNPIAAAKTPLPIAAATAAKSTPRPGHLKSQLTAVSLKERLDQCIFCEAPTKENEDQEKHFCASCPMLSPCPGCTQVVEVSNLSGHLASECPQSGNYKKCPRCNRSVSSSDLSQHVAASACPKSSPGMTPCPLCNTAIHDNDKSWKYHLMRVCSGNPRRSKAAADHSPTKVDVKVTAATPLSRPPSYIPTVGSSPARHLSPSAIIASRSASRIPTLAARSPRMQQP